MDVTTETDEAIVRAMAQGDKGALARAFDRYAATLTRYAWATNGLLDAVVGEIWGD